MPTLTLPLLANVQLGTAEVETPPSPVAPVGHRWLIESVFSEWTSPAALAAGQNLTVVERLIIGWQPQSPTPGTPLPPPPGSQVVSLGPVSYSANVTAPIQGGGALQLQSPIPIEPTRQIAYRLSSTPLGTIRSFTGGSVTISYSLERTHGGEYPREPSRAGTL